MLKSLAGKAIDTKAIADKEAAALAAKIKDMATAGIASAMNEVAEVHKATIQALEAKVAELEKANAKLAKAEQQVADLKDTISTLEAHNKEAELAKKALVVKQAETEKKNAELLAANTSLTKELTATKNEVAQQKETIELLTEQNQALREENNGLVEATATNSEIKLSSTSTVTRSDSPTKNINEFFQTAHIDDVIQFVKSERCPELTVNFENRSVLHNIVKRSSSLRDPLNKMQELVAALHVKSPAIFAFTDSNNPLSMAILLQSVYAAIALLSFCDANWKEPGTGVSILLRNFMRPNATERPSSTFLTYLIPRITDPAEFTKEHPALGNKSPMQLLEQYYAENNMRYKAAYEAMKSRCPAVANDVSTALPPVVSSSAVATTSQTTPRFFDPPRSFPVPVASGTGGFQPPPPILPLQRVSPDPKKREANAELPATKRAVTPATAPKPSAPK